MASKIIEFLILDFLAVCYCVRIGQCRCQIGSFLDPNFFLGNYWLLLVSFNNKIFWNKNPQAKYKFFNILWLIISQWEFWNLSAIKQIISN